MSAAEEQFRPKATWLLRETGFSALEADPRIPPHQKKMHWSDSNDGILDYHIVRSGLGET